MSRSPVRTVSIAWVMSVSLQGGAHGRCSREESDSSRRARADALASSSRPVASMSAMTPGEEPPTPRVPPEPAPRRRRPRRDDAAGRAQQRSSLAAGRLLLRHPRERSIARLRRQCAEPRSQLTLSRQRVTAALQVRHESCDWLRSGCVASLAGDCCADDATGRSGSARLSLSANSATDRAAARWRSRYLARSS